MKLPSKLMYVVCKYKAPYLVIIPPCYSRLLHVFGVYQNQNQNSLLVKRQNDNTSPGDWPRKISP